MKQSLKDVRLTQWASGAGCAAKMCSRDLSEILAPLPASRDLNLLVGLKTADDAGVYRIGDDLALVDTVDFFPPMVDDPFDFGRIAAANALSDVYAMGARPVTAMNLVAFPVDELEGEVLLEILRGGLSMLEAAGAALVGGHSIVDREVKYGLAVTGLVDPARVVTNAGARPGDVLLLTKPIGVGIVNTAIKRGAAEASTVAGAVASMTRLNKAASEVMLRGEVHACTDITGFGLLGHALEMARASGVAIRLESDRVATLPHALDLCADGIKPGGLANNRRSCDGAVTLSPDIAPAMQDLLYDPQTSGGLLMALPEARAWETVQQIAEEQGTEPFIVGGVVPRDQQEAFVHVD